MRQALDRPYKNLPSSARASRTFEFDASSLSVRNRVSRFWLHSLGTKSGTASPVRRTNECMIHRKKYTESIGRSVDKLSESGHNDKAVAQKTCQIAAGNQVTTYRRYRGE